MWGSFVSVWFWVAHSVGTEASRLRGRCVQRGGLYSGKEERKKGVSVTRKATLAPHFPVDWPPEMTSALMPRLRPRHSSSRFRSGALTSHDRGQWTVLCRLSMH